MWEMWLINVGDLADICGKCGWYMWGVVGDICGELWVVYVESYG